jgi:hypothetical protein
MAGRASAADFWIRGGAIQDDAGTRVASAAAGSALCRERDRYRCADLSQGQGYRELRIHPDGHVDVVPRDPYRLIVAAAVGGPSTAEGGHSGQRWTDARHAHDRRVRLAPEILTDWMAFLASEASA